MPAQIFGTDAVVIMLNRAFNDVSPSNAVFQNQVAAAGTTTDSQTAFAKQFGAGFAGLTADALSTKLLGNLGVLPNAGLQTALKDYITAAGVENVGIIALQLGQILSGLENASGGQAGFAAAAVAWNNEVAGAYNYSANPANTQPSGQGPVTPPGNTFTFSDKVGETLTGTSGNDTFSGVIGTGGTVNVGDAISASSGTDTFNLLVSAGATAAAGLPAGFNVADVEVVNVNYIGAGAADVVGALKSSTFTGVQQLWQIDKDKTAVNFQDVTVAAGVTAGFESTAAKDSAAVLAAATLVEAASATQKTLDVAVKGLLTGSGVTLKGAGVETLTLTGSITTDGTNTFALANNNTVLKTANIGVTTGTTVTGLDAFGATLTTVDFSTSTGAVKADLSTNTLVKLNSIKGGAANETLTVDLGLGASKVVVDTGAGVDSLTLKVSATVADDQGAVTLGAGKDALIIAAVANVTATPTTAAELVSKLVTVTDFKTTEDLLDLKTSANGVALTAPQLAAIADKSVNTDLLAATKAASTIIGVNKSAVFTYDGNAYVYTNDADAGVDAGDGLIKLTGVDASLFVTGQNGNFLV